MNASSSLLALLLVLAPFRAEAATETVSDGGRESGVRVGILLGGLALPDATAFAGGAMLDLSTVRTGFQTRLIGLAYHTADGHTTTNGGAFIVQENYWLGAVYGLGFGGGLGYASFTKEKSGGWDDSSGQVIAYAAPVLLRFGERPTFELGLNAGATRFFAHDVRPFGFAYGSVRF